MNPAKASALLSDWLIEETCRSSVPPVPEVMAKIAFGLIVACDGSGRRLGRGGGYYDRALAAAGARGVLRVGLAYEDQIVEAVPVEPHDQTLDVVVTECGIHGPGGSG